MLINSRKERMKKCSNSPQWSTIICYQLTCYQPHLLSPHLLSPHLLSNSFAINSVDITFICYQASFAIRPQLLSTHLLSGQFAINPQLQSTILLSIIICYQIFALLSIIILETVFSKNPQKMEKFLKIWNFQSLANFA